MSWVWIGIAVAACFCLKLVGLLVPERALSHPVIDRVAQAVPVALLGALIAIETFTVHQRIVVDARAIALAVAGVALWRRAPFLVVVILAAATAAVLRWSGLAG